MGIDYLVCSECGQGFPDVMDYSSCCKCEGIICGGCAEDLIEKYGYCDDIEHLEDWRADYEKEDGEEFWSELPKHCSECADDNIKSEKYIDELEKLLIFMCSSYEEMRSITFKKAPNLRVEIPTIQGCELNAAIGKLAKMKQVKPEISAGRLLAKIEKNRTSDYTEE